MKIFSTSPLFLLLTPSSSQDQRFTAHPSSPATHILAEQYLSTLTYNAPLTINSDVPVTLQRYSDTSTSFLIGQEPVPSNYGMVVVTSDCTTDQTSAVPEISVSENGDSITVAVGVSQEEGASMSFLEETTRYSAFWSYVFGFCGFNYFGTTSSSAAGAAMSGGDTASPASSPGVVVDSTASPTENVTFTTDATSVDWNAYEDCGFDCCANSDCAAGCCIEGRCQSNASGEFELCANPPLSPPDGVVCGATAYKNFQADGNCPDKGATTTTTTSAAITVTTTTFGATNATVSGAESNSSNSNSSTSTPASIDESTTTAAAIATTSDGGTASPCAQGTCLNPDGQCATVTMCFADPCAFNNGGCADGVECISNYCGGCNAVCVGGTTSSIVTTAAATTTVAAIGSTATSSPSISGDFGSNNGTLSPTASSDESPTASNNETLSLTAVNETSSPSASNTAADNNPCVPGKCLNLAGQCAEEVVCIAAPCDTIQCAPFQQCVANLCGDCVAVCVGSETGVPTIDPSPEPTPFPSGTSSTPAPVSSTTAPKPVSAVEETNVSGPTASDQSPNPTTASILQQPTTVQPTPKNPANPVVVIVNVPSQTVVVPAPSNNGGPAPVDDPAANSGSTTAATEPAGTDATAFALGSGTSPSPATSDVLDTYANISVVDVLDTLSPVSNVGDGTAPPSPAATPWPTGGDNATATNSPAPSVGAAGDRGFIGAIQEDSTSSGFTAGYLFRIRTAVTLAAVLAAALVVPGREGAAGGFGKLFVAAVAASSLVSRSDRNGNVRRNSKEASRVVSMRNLQGTCTYNVEILYDGCTKNVQVNAPAARVVDVVMEDYTSETNAEDECQSDYTANLTFPLSDSTLDVDLVSNNTVAAYDYSDWQCQRAIEGRPFIDASGKGIQALPILAQTCVDESNVAWSGKASADLIEAVSRNGTHRNQVMLGNEWTQRALGEHASIASFSAFSIALMTNLAPSTLVEDALKAGLDEVRHARTSFEIASRLLGRNVEPGSLPESKHEFGQDLTALALAVAREGCVDETLSAFAAAAEVDAIDKFLVVGAESSKYSHVERDVLRWISNELRTIAMEESYHSALAWRTLKWVCGVDSKACSEVRREVFDASKLDVRFEQRSEGNSSFASLMKEEWERIHNAHKLSSFPSDPSICASTIQYSWNEPLISTLTEIVLQAIVC